MFAYDIRIYALDYEEHVLLKQFWWLSSNALSLSGR